MKEQDVEEVRKKFFAQVQEEYENFRFGQISGGIERAYKNSLKITFYKEVYRYLMDDVLHDEEYIEFLGEPIIQNYGMYLLSASCRGRHEITFVSL